MTATAETFVAKDYKSDLKPIWCPGCGDFGVVKAIYQAFAAIGVAPHNIAFFSGIGCSSRIPGYTTAYGFNSVHGRSLPMAEGAKLANPKLTVVVAGGDGDGFSIGGGHVPHVVRRNPDMTYVVMDNRIYGLTKGQCSPTTPPGTVSVTTPYGISEKPINPVLLVLAYECGFVAQGSTSDLKQMARLIEAGIRYPGFAFINIQSPCVTYGRDDDQVKELRRRTINLDENGHDPSDKLAAYAIAEEYGKKLHTGLIFKRERYIEYTKLEAKLIAVAKAKSSYPPEKVFEHNFLVQ